MGQCQNENEWIKSCMDYEFHVGDYVETKDGTIGYISSVLATGDAW